jgi:hypothetical protein
MLKRITITVLIFLALLVGTEAQSPRLVCLSATEGTVISMDAEALRYRLSNSRPFVVALLIDGEVWLAKGTAEVPVRVILSNTDGR